MYTVAQLTDQTVGAAAEGSPDEMRRVVEALQSRVKLMVAVRLGPTPPGLDSLEDIVQQVFVALSGGIGRLENRTVGGLKAFLSAIVAHKVSDLLARRATQGAALRTVSLDATVRMLSEAGPLWQFLSGSGTSPLSAAQRAEEAARVMFELDRLEPRHREVITLAFFDQLPMREIARLMGATRPAASMLLVRAIGALRRNITGCNGKETRNHDARP